MIGKHLKQIRTSKNLTLREVGEKIDKDHSHVSLIENGRLNPEDETIINILVKAFDFPFSVAKNTVAQWRIEDVLEKAPDPSGVINNIVTGDKSIVITGNQNNISSSSKD